MADADQSLAQQLSGAAKPELEGRTSGHASRASIRKAPNNGRAHKEAVCPPPWLPYCNGRPEEENDDAPPCSHFVPKMSVRRSARLHMRDVQTVRRHAFRDRDECLMWPACRWEALTQRVLSFLPEMIRRKAS